MCIGRNHETVYLFLYLTTRIRGVINSELFKLLATGYSSSSTVFSRQQRNRINMIGTRAAILNPSMHRTEVQDGKSQDNNILEMQITTQTV